MASSDVANGYQQATTRGASPSATLRNRTRALGSNVRLYWIDGKGPKDFGLKGKFHGGFNSRWNDKFEVDLTPGRHILSVSFADAFGEAPPQHVSFVAKSGHSYVVDGGVVPEKGYRWIVTIEDVTDKDFPQAVPVRLDP